MEEDLRSMPNTENAQKKRKAQYMIETSVSRAVGSVAEVLGEYVQIARQHIELFLGAALTIVGVLSFNSDKYCDGNTVEYLSCTRPNTYYYFSGFDIALVVVGVSLILIWVVKNRSTKKR